MNRIRTFLFLLLFPLLSQAQTLTNGSSNLMINGIRHWVKVGGAEHKTTPLVVLHGGPGGNHYVFERTAGAELEKFMTVIYYEQRGSGRSAAEPDGIYTVPLMVNDLEALRKHFKLEHIIPMGYSFGASLALEYTLAYPQNVKGLILESFATLQDSAVLLSQMANFYFQAREHSRPKMDSILAGNSTLNEKYSSFWNMAKREDVMRFLFHDQNNARKVFDLWAESKIGNSGLVMKSLMKEHRKINLFDDAKKVTAPTLLLAGVYDRNGALPATLRLKEEIKDSDIRIFLESAHFPDFEETGSFVETIRGWLKERDLIK